MDRKIKIALLVVTALFAVAQLGKAIGLKFPGFNGAPAEGMEFTIPISPAQIADLTSRYRDLYSPGGTVPEQYLPILRQMGFPIPENTAGLRLRFPTQQEAQIYAAALTPTAAPTRTPTVTPTLRAPVMVSVPAGKLTVTMAVMPEKVVDFGLGVSDRVDGQIKSGSIVEYPFAGYRLWFGQSCPLVPGVGCRNQKLVATFPATQTVFLTMEDTAKDGVTTGPNVLFANGTAKFVKGEVGPDTNTITTGGVTTATLTATSQTLTTVGHRYVGRNGPQVPALVIAVMEAENTNGQVSLYVKDLWYVVPQGDGGQIFKAIPSLAPATIVPPATTATKMVAEKTPTPAPTPRR